MELKYADYCWDGPSFRQRELTVTQTYNTAYLDARYAEIDGRVQALSLVRLRVLGAFVECGSLLDFGCGIGHFVDAANSRGWDAWGTDVVHHPRHRVIIHNPEMTPQSRILNADDVRRHTRFTRWRVATFFDSLEHLSDPGGTITELNPRWLMVSVPECHYPEAPVWFMAWKHRRPGEHLWHWNRRTLSVFMATLGYAEVMVSSFEDEYRPNHEQPEPNILTAIYRRRSSTRGSP